MRNANILPVLLIFVALPALAADPPAAKPPATTPQAAPAAGAGTGQAIPTDPAASATPGGREAELAALVPARTADDELVWLDATEGRFFAFRRNPTRGAAPRAAVLIVPGSRAFIDQNPLTLELREIPRHGGFTTLAVQVPLVEATPPPPPGPPTAPPADPAAAPAAPTAVPDPLCGRLTAALALLESTRPPYIALVAEGESAERVQACYATGLPPSVKAFAAIGSWRGKLADLKVPSIEFVPARNARAMKEADRRRLSMPKPPAPPHRREDIDAVDQHFKGAELDVAKRLRGWLEKLPPPVSLPQGAAPTAPVSR